MVVQIMSTVMDDIGRRGFRYLMSHLKAAYDTAYSVISQTNSFLGRSGILELG